MKTVFTSKEIAHIWANEGAPGGRCPSSMSFERDSFNSYNTTIARRIRYRGKSAIIIDGHHFSPSTSKHQNHVRAALLGTTEKFSVNIGSYNQTLDFTPATLRDFYLRERKAKRANAKSLYVHVRAQEVDLQAYYLSEAIRVCEFFGLATARLLVERDKCAEQYAQARAIVDQYASQRATKREARRVKERERELARDRENVPKWTAGENVYLSWHQPALLRAVNGDMETSKGARVPIGEAERAYRFAIVKRERGWRRNGEQFAIGHYSLDAVNEEGVIAGCHRIAWSEIERFAQAQGWKV